MAFDSTITTIDIGTSKIRAVIGRFDEQDNKNFHVLWIGISASNAIRKGNILDMEEFKNNLDKALEEAEKMAGEQVSGVFLSFNSSSFEVITNKWVIAVSWTEITQDDIDRVLDMAKNGVDMPNKEILKVIPEYFVVDLEEGVKNPLSMSARKLEVIANIFSMNTNVLNNIKKAVADVGIEIYDIYPNLLSSPEWVLTKRQKELGVVCIDIGASTTGVTVYEEGVMKFASLIWIGGDNVTNDIALWVRTSIDIAEKLKFDYSELNLEKLEKYTDQEIDLSKLHIGEDGMLSRLYLSQIATARYEEIFYFVKEELRKVGKDGMLPEGAILVGGWAKARGIIDTAKEVLRLPCFIGTPVEKDNVSDTTISDPVFAGAIGSLILANRYAGSAMGFSLNLGSMFGSIIKVIKKILP
jgi:cell division protein FtsA